MKPILLLFISVILFSCIQYQYLTVTGVNISKNEQKELISENDTLKVQYVFSPGQIGIKIYNKLQEPLEVVWNKSALVMNGQAVGYYSPNQTISASVENVSRQYQRTTVGFGEVRGELQGSEQVQFIPPLSFIESRPLSYPQTAFENIPYENAKKANLPGSPNSQLSVQYKWFSFDKENSPARFRSYLTCRSARGEFAVEHQFYISDAWKSASGPEYFTRELFNRGDRFYFLQY